MAEEDNIAHVHYWSSTVPFQTPKQRLCFEIRICPYKYIQFNPVSGVSSKEMQWQLEKRQNLMYFFPSTWTKHWTMFLKMLFDDVNVKIHLKNCFFTSLFFRYFRYSIIRAFELSKHFFSTPVPRCLDY